MRVELLYTDYCLPDYFGGDSRPWVAIYPTERGYTSRELRRAILAEFDARAIGGNDTVAWDYISDEQQQKRAEKFYAMALPACVNRIKFRGKKLKLDKETLKHLKKYEDEDIPLMHFVFNIVED